MKQTAQPINKLIKGFLKTLGTKRVRKQQDLTQVWEEIVGPSVAAYTRIAGEKQNILYVKVNSAPILSELANFRKKGILQKLRVASKRNYRDINFIAGGW